MALKSKGKQLSFEILSSTSPVNPDTIIDRSNSEPLPSNNKSNRRKRRAKRKKSNSNSPSPIEINTIFENGAHIEVGELDEHEHEHKASSISHSIAQTFSVCEVREESVSTVSQVSMGELRQRNVSGGGAGSDEKQQVDVDVEVDVNSRPNFPNGNLESAGSLDWGRYTAEDPTYPFPLENSPIKFLMDEMYSGNSLRSTTTVGNEKERERVYDTIFRLPWRCELLIDVGFFVCLNSFLSLLTIIPMRASITLWRFFTKRQSKKPSAAELSDFACLLVLVGGITLLGRTDISLIYHMIRGQGIIKLYVVYNVLEIFDKLWQSFGSDVFQTLFNSAKELSSCSSPESSRSWLEKYIIDLLLAAAALIIHSFILLAQAITLSTCIVAHNNALIALLVSNNFAEIKSNVFKRFSKDNVHSIVYSDSIERFHISAFVMFVLAQNIQEAEGPWLGSFLSNALLVYFSEVAIDIVKHSFIAKFNDIKPIAYSEFLEDLCKQTLNIETDGAKKTLTFVPLAPACVVIRVLTPVYAARLPSSPLPWRFFVMTCLGMLTYVMLVSLKVMVGMGLRKHATWYIKRCQNRKLHSD